MTIPDSDGRDAPEPIDRIVRPLEVFAGRPTAGVTVLLAATALALAWANSPWSASYDALRTTELTIGVGEWALSKTLLRWVNEGLMAVFFFVISLEIKREILVGELSNPRRAALPFVAAIGGMVVPAAVYLLLNSEGPSIRGWGIPMSTDVAFALGVLAILGDRVPLAAKLMLTAVAIVDDVGAILVIAVFYTDSIAFSGLAIGGVFFLLAVGANRLGVRNPATYFLLGLLMWFGFVQSGVHATLASVFMAAVIPARSRLDSPRFLDRMRDRLDRFEYATPSPGRHLLTRDQQHLTDDMADLVEGAVAPLQLLEHALLPVTTFVVLPAFALLNAGTPVGGQLLDAVTSPVAMGIILGLFLGKPVGIVVFSWLAIRLGVAELPSRMTWRHVYGIGALAGIGFTMSLFVGSLAFGGVNLPLRDIAKIGTLVGSTLSAVTAWCLLRSSKLDVTDAA